MSLCSLLSSLETQNYVQSVAYYSQNIKRLANTLIRLCIFAGWSEPLLVPHTTLLEISCRGSDMHVVLVLSFVYFSSRCQLLELRLFFWQKLVSMTQCVYTVDALYVQIQTKALNCYTYLIFIYVIDKGYFSEAFLFKLRGGRSPPSGLNIKPRKNPLFSL